MKIAIDFDGVICNLPGIIRGHDFSNCKPKKDALDAMNWLEEEGHEIWIFTSRPQREWNLIRDWLHKWGFKQQMITDTKTNATIYLDDRAVRFTSWQDFCKLVG